MKLTVTRHLGQAVQIIVIETLVVRTNSVYTAFCMVECQLDATEVFIADCLLNMFRAPLCPSSGAQEYYTVVAACGISCCGFQVAGLVRS